MKTNLSLLMIIAVALFSCKKDKSVTPEKQPSTIAVTKYPVSFSASAFSSQTSAFGTKAVNGVKKTQALKDQISFLQYYVTRIDSPGIIIKTVIQKSTDANFGTIRDTLPNGNYRIVFLGTETKDIDVAAYNNSYEDNPESLWPLYVFDDIPGSYPLSPSSMGDVFLKVLTLTVTTRTNTDIVMDRLVGKINVVIQDAIPANVTRIECRERLPRGYDIISNKVFSTGNGVPLITFFHNVVPSDIGTKGFTFSTTCFPTGANIELFGFDAAGNVLFDRYVSDNEPVKANTTLTFSGTLFDNSSITNITTNPVWGPATTLPFTDY
ncbi:hypothetical protein [Mucilaginibacter agri]|uniref:Fimbrillin-A associated anchor protein Mfa1 and Mfa2 n=1 Tax=Mucilaginibacter agri TaxID=2695265 RepID=A0A965ZJF2_9SPHI|nr:hypothetical protein [Mucilaginibacter agri]NCD72258.1 hypothetical protein [Mucilaginibacter agri]